MRAHVALPFALVGAAANHAVLAVSPSVAPEGLAALMVSPGQPHFVFAWAVGFLVAGVLGRVVEVTGHRPAVAALGSLPAAVVILALDRFAGGFGVPADVSVVGAALLGSFAIAPAFAFLARAARDAEATRAGSEVGPSVRRTKWVVAASAILGAAAVGHATPLQILLVGLPVYMSFVAIALTTVPALVGLRALARQKLSPVSPDLLGDSFGPRSTPRPRVVDAGVGEGALALVRRGGAPYRDPEVVETVVRGDVRAAASTLTRSLAVQLAAAGVGVVSTIAALR